MEAIDPSTFDVIVASSGVVECLLASALARAGKSVLLMDQADVYGSGHASFTFAGLAGSRDPELNPHACGDAEATLTQQPVLPALARVIPLISQQGLPVTEVESCWAAGQAATQTRGFILDLAPKVLYQAELMVDVLIRTKSHNYVEFKAVEGSFIYQGGRLRPIPASRADIFKDKLMGLADKRALMAFLAACMAAKEGQGQLKGALTSDQPLSAVLEAQGLTPALRDIVLYGIASTSWRQDASQANPASNTAQPASQQQTTGAASGQPRSSSQAPTGAVDADSSLPVEHSNGSPAGVVEAGSARPGLLAHSGSHTGAGSMPASEGLAVLSLYAASLGRFGTAPGALMAASYGSGSLPEAFVRHCAVKGCVTALRQRVAGLVVGPPGPVEDLGNSESQQGLAEGQAGAETLPAAAAGGSDAPTEAAAVDGAATAGSGAADDGSGTGSPGAAANEAAADVPAKAVTGTATAADGTATAADETATAADGTATAAGRTGTTGVAAAALPVSAANTTTTVQGAGPSAPQSEGEVVRGLVLSTGQVLQCREAVVIGRQWLSIQPELQDHVNMPAFGDVRVARAVAVLDHSVVPSGQGLAVLVLPPEAGGAGNQQPVYGLQLSSAAAVAPPGRFLLYLSTMMPSAPEGVLATPRQLLEPSLALLAGLPPAEEANPEATPEPVQPEAAETSRTSTTRGQPATAAKPQVLQVHYYVQTLQQPQPSANADQIRSTSGQARELQGDALLPPNLIICPGPGPTFFGYVDEVAHAESLLAQHFPDVPWLLAEPEEAAEGVLGSGEESDEGYARATGHDNGDDDAIDELQQALGALMANTPADSKSQT